MSVVEFQEIHGWYGKYRLEVKLEAWRANYRVRNEMLKQDELKKAHLKAVCEVKLLSCRQLVVGRKL